MKEAYRDRLCFLNPKSDVKHIWKVVPRVDAINNLEVPVHEPDHDHFDVDEDPLEEAEFVQPLVVIPPAMVVNAPEVPALLDMPVEDDDGIVESMFKDIGVDSNTSLTIVLETMKEKIHKDLGEEEKKKGQTQREDCVVPEKSKQEAPKEKRNRRGKKSWWQSIPDRHQGSRHVEDLEVVLVGSFFFE
ncbi:hypothetical protein AMTR_s00010p00136880 [Amborella trichopoda]|uniref:Uncharacterized protein n=1 Tax=Amborella trichopoda TaxID=13333 RepID=W1NF65_AMBTC|nr:hypothetical protein AMTR_s00010p00136880 [Amborella trichopoda]